MYISMYVCPIMNLSIPKFVHTYIFLTFYADSKIVKQPNYPKICY